MISKEASQ